MGAQTMVMRLVVGRRPVRLPWSRPCDADEVRQAVDRANPPFCVHPAEAPPFTVRRRVFLEAAGLRVECEDEGELRLACKLSAEEHNRWQTPDDSLAMIRETRRMEEDAERRAAEEDADDREGRVCEEEDITLEEWSQMGYKWFRKDEMAYV
jgi:hypothetical protein